MSRHKPEQKSDQKSQQRHSRFARPNNTQTKKSVDKQAKLTSEDKFEQKFAEKYGGSQYKSSSSPTEDAKSTFSVRVWLNFIPIIKSQLKYLIYGVVMVMIIAIVDAFYPYMTKTAVDSFINKGTLDGVASFMIFFSILALAQSVASYFMIIFNNKVATGVTHTLRLHCFEKLQHLQLNYFNNTPTGWIMSRMTSDIQKLANTLSGNLINMLQYVVSVILYAVFMLVLNWRLALIVLAILPVLLLISYFFQSRMLKNYRHVRRLNSIVTNSFSEGISGTQTIKTMVTEEKFKDDFAEQTNNMRNFAVHSAVFANFYHPLVMLLASTGTALILWRGGLITDSTLNIGNVAVDIISVGTLSAFLTYVSSFFNPIQMLAGIFSEIQYAQASAERIFGLLNTEETIKDSPEIIEKYGDIMHPNKALWPEIKGTIDFDNVSFSYNPDEPIYDNFNLHINAGETIAIVGETGSGKTTLVNLICRFFEPISGRVLIDGIDYKEMPLLWLYSNIGYVLQNSHLFSGSIRDNIKYANKDATDEQVIEAAKMVNAHNFIMDMRKGYDTEVGENGSRLSEGEKQLISFARAILSNPSIFILDEATSSVDTQTEHLIKDAIDKILEGRTSFLIAHRLSTIRSADRILVIDGGRVVEDGTHEELLESKGRYYTLYTNQFLRRSQQGKW